MSQFHHTKKQRLKLFDNLKFLTVSQVATVLNVPQKTIRHWVYRREIPFYKIGRHVRFDPFDIENWIFERRKTNDSRI